MVGYGDMGGYGANGARLDPRAYMGPSGRALHWFHIPPYPPTTYIYFMYISGLLTDNCMYLMIPERGPQTVVLYTCLLYTSPSPRDQRGSRMPSSA